MPLPSEVEDLTPEWFTSVLATQVTGVEVLAAHSGTTGRAKLRLHYAAAQDDTERPDTVFCKLAPFEARQRGAFLRRTGIGVMEARFYASLSATVPVRVPRPWYAATTDDGEFVMVLEDIDGSGCTFPRPADPDIAERAASTVEELAALHAAHWEDPAFERELAWVPERAGFGGDTSPAAITAAGAFTRRALDRFANEMPLAFEEVGALYVERVADVLDLWDRGERTLIHGDPHSGNLFTDGGRTGFFDWAMFSRSPGLRDVAYYCCNSLPTEVRRSIEGDLLDSYHAALGRRGIAIDRATVDEQYRLFAVYSWVSASSTAAVGDRWQPSRLAMAALHRTTAAIDDLDSLGVLHDLLG